MRNLLLPLLLLSVLTACDPPRAGTSSNKSSNPSPAPVASGGNGISDCGPSSNDNCSASLRVTGGTFYRGTDTANPATISDFRLDKYEVTVGRFRKFVDAWVGGWRPAPGGARVNLPNSGWDASWNGQLASNLQGWNTNLRCASGANWTDSVGVNERRPINCLSWYDLSAFCTWDGGFLPTEAEWEYAAAGGNEERTFPWGNVDPSSNLAVSKTSSTSNVGMFPNGNGRWGHSDMSGNVWEWTLDWYHDTYKTPCTDCANLDPSPARVIRGGSFYRNEVSLAAAYRYSFDPVTRNDGYGGRCARTP